MTTAKHPIEELFTYRLHVLKKQTDRTMNEAFSLALGLSLTEARILLSVGAFGPISVSDLGRVSNLDRSQASRATDALERKGLLEKASNAADARGVLVKLGAQGRNAYRRASAISTAQNEAILAALSAHEREVLQGALAKLVAVGGEEE
ncbi:DNA-binding MarR family transcriptional regulator [Paraburkholderia bannensis]|uniref:DNA-binding MarR family transcriptional regulator n=1 Tax=Paraburkholderia bannensis TaxID=765414 RepID=A0A7W9WW80_9BURK|nr:MULTISPECIES: MarR family winged helix-turn-helix transcriptional regulator [Paraburkholderia]MBB3261503.1 DNA-binding MarR family transcriptional regulator [Paraburkholderia sp. WP4_3_2]MBB6106559.1 DNA-binding MarR family transcriptional regulator [Paraburkholderia bannensis]